jgi:hypothetical protein
VNQQEADFVCRVTIRKVARRLDRRIHDEVQRTLCIGGIPMDIDLPDVVVVSNLCF